MSDPVEFIFNGIERVLAASGTFRDLVWLSDANIDLSGGDVHENDFLDRMAESGLEWCPTEWTRRVGCDKGSTIDHVFVRNFGLDHVEVRYLDSRGISDHELIRVDLVKRLSVPDSSEPSRNIMRTDWKIFEEELRSANIRALVEEGRQNLWSVG